MAELGPRPAFCASWRRQYALRAWALCASVLYGSTHAATQVDGVYVEPNQPQCADVSATTPEDTALELSLACSGGGYLGGLEVGYVRTAAGTGVGGFDGDGGIATAALLNLPNGVSVDRSGNLYIAESGGHRVRRVSLANGVITTIAGDGVAGFSGDGGLGEVRLNDPRYAIADSAGHVFIADIGNSRIRRVDVGTGLVTTVVGGGTAGAAEGVAGTEATLVALGGIAFDAAGDLFVVETGRNRIRRVARGADGLVTGAPDEVIVTVVGTGLQGYSGDDGPALTAQFSAPQDLAFDPLGNLFVADSQNHRVRRVAAGSDGVIGGAVDEIVTTTAGGGTAAGDGVAATTIALNLPRGVTVDGAGHLYISEAGALRVRRVEHGSGVISTVLGGSALGEDIPAATARTFNPRGLAIGLGGTLFVAELGAHRVRAVQVGPPALTYEVIDPPAHGEAILSEDGALRFQPYENFAGEDLLTFQVMNGAGQESGPATVRVTITAVNDPPSANAGRDQTVGIGSVVQLDGSSSHDIDGSPITFAWAFVSRPSGSVDGLQGADTAHPTFTAAMAGVYVLDLTVADPLGEITTDTVTISAIPLPDLVVRSVSAVFDGEKYDIQLVAANQGEADVAVDSPVILGQSTDGVPDSGDEPLRPLTGNGPCLLLVPPLAAGAQSGPLTISCRPGTPGARAFVIAGIDPLLRVQETDETNNATAARVAAADAPVAHAGADQTVGIGSTVQLDGSGSHGPYGTPNTFSWAFTSRPSGSSDGLQGADTAHPTLTPTVVGVYVVELTVTDTFGQVATDSVTITASPPPDLVVSSVTAVFNGETFDIQLAAANRGAGDIGIDSEVILMQSSDDVLDTGDRPLLTGQGFCVLTVPPLPTGATSGPLAISCRPGTSDARAFVIAVIDPFFRVPETDETNNVTAASVLTTVGPDANAGADRTVVVGSVVQLDGTGSHGRPAGTPITFSWAFAQRPPGSGDGLQGANTATPTFTPTVAGVYVVELTVIDAFAQVDTDSVTIIATPPADLVVSSLSAVFNGETFDVQLVAANRGTGDVAIGIEIGLAQSSDEFVDPGDRPLQSLTGQGFCVLTVPPLPAGATSGPLAISCRPGTSDARAFVIAVIDPFGRVQESDETNNVTVARVDGPDADNDGILDEIDPQPVDYSSSFSDVPSGGTTSGDILERGAQLVTLSDEASPSGIRVSADASGGEAPATVSVCGGASQFSFTPGDVIVVTCGSVTVEVVSGAVESTYLAGDGSVATATLVEGNSLTFEPETATVTAAAGNAAPIVVHSGGIELHIAPGLEAPLVKLVQLDIKPGTSPNTINLGAAGTVPAAILSSADFAAPTEIDLESLRLIGAAVNLVGKADRPQCGREDVNADGWADLVCHFITAEVDLQPGDAAGVLLGRLLSGRQIRGEDTLRVVP